MGIVMATSSVEVLEEVAEVVLLARHTPESIVRLRKMPTIEHNLPVLLTSTDNTIILLF